MLSLFTLNLEVKGGDILENIVKVGLVAVAVVMVVVGVLIAYNFGYFNNSNAKIVGTYDVKGSADWVRFYANGTTYAKHEGNFWSGTWILSDNGEEVMYSVNGGPDLTLEITEDGKLTWQNRVYIKRTEVSD